MPSPFVPTVASPFNAPSRTTLVHSKAKARYGIFPLPVGDSLAIYPCDRGNPLSLTVTLPNEQRIVVPEAVVLSFLGFDYYFVAPINSLAGEVKEIPRKRAQRRGMWVRT
jgi:hypothetical protein